MASITQTRMTAAEFAALPESNLPTELIDGELIMTPAPLYTHQKIVGELFALLKRMATDGVTVISPADVYLDDLNVVQPDVFWIKRSGTNCKLGEDDHWHGPPDLVVEILSDDIRNHYDKVHKFRIYAKHGVSEYWIVHPGDRWVEVWVLEAGRYQHRGTFTSDESFPSPVLGGKTIPLAEVFAP